MSFLDDMKQLAQQTKQQTEQQQKAMEQQEQNKRRPVLLASMSNQCQEWATTLKSDIERAASGKSYDLGSITYNFKEKNGNYLMVRPIRFGIDNIIKHDIESTDGYRNLKHICDELGVSIELTNRNTDYWYIIVSGWY